MTPQQVAALYSATSALVQQFGSISLEPMPSVLDMHQEHCRAAVPAEQFQALTLQFQDGLQEASRQKQQLMRELEEELQDRSQLEKIMEDCLEKLARL